MDRFMANEMQITVRLVELQGGGFIIAEQVIGGETIEYDATQAVSTIDEACGVVQRRLQGWAVESKRLKAAREQDENVIPMKKAPRLWWRNAG